MRRSRVQLRFARVDGGRVVPDTRHVHLDSGLSKGRLYQIAYTAVGARVLSLGMVALRDCAAWLRYGGADDGNPAAGALRHAYAYGRSQTGRLLRTLIHHDLNVDEPAAVHTTGSSPPWPSRCSASSTTLVQNSRTSGR